MEIVYILSIKENWGAYISYPFSLKEEERLLLAYKEFYCGRSQDLKEFSI